ncbi:hypothetical protein K438DRAFT_1759275 [Mycena galopus ATCC 62051]|nr:hypothetical protein K438DRAFT_1759275 [Mycena galopus ATCC 62051]
MSRVRRNVHTRQIFGAVQVKVGHTKDFATRQHTYLKSVDTKLNLAGGSGTQESEAVRGHCGLCAMFLLNVASRILGPLGSWRRLGRRKDRIRMDVSIGAGTNEEDFPLRKKKIISILYLVRVLNP